MLKIKQIYENLKVPDETVVFQVKRKFILNKMIKEFNKKCDSFIYRIDFDKYTEIPLKNIYLFVGKWRLGAAGIFPVGSKYNEKYTFDNFCIDYKSTLQDQYIQEKLVNNFIEIMDKYREYIKISKKTFEEVASWKE